MPIILFNSSAGSQSQIVRSDDLNNWFESVLIGFGAQLSETINAWNDTIFLVGVSTLNLSDDNSSNLVESLQVGFGILISDSNTNFQDAAIIQALTASGDLLLDLTDDLNSPWSDDRVVSTNNNFSLSLNDDLNNWLDTNDVVESLEEDQNDDLNPFWNNSIDFFSNTFLDAQVDDLNSWQEELVVDFGILLTDTNENNWSDVLTSFYVGIYLQPLSDTNSSNWSDFLSGEVKQEFWFDKLSGTVYGLGLVDNIEEIYGRGYDLSDSLNFSDQVNLALGYVLQPGENASSTWLDQIIFGYSYEEDLNDFFNNFDDLLDLTLFQLEDEVDDLNNWLDDIGIGVGLDIYDQTNFFFDDFIEIGYGLVLEDTSSLSDFVQIFFNGVAIQLSFSDQLFIDDLLGLGIGLIFEETNTISDIIEVSSPNSVSLVDNTLNNYLDDILVLYGITLDAQDSLDNWLDSFEFTNDFVLELEDVSDFSTDLQEFVELNIEYRIISEDENGNNWFEDENSPVFISPTFEFVDDLNTWDDFVESGFGITIGLGDFNTNNLLDTIDFGDSFGIEVEDDSNLLFEDIQFEAIPENPEIQLIVSSNGSLSWDDSIISIYELELEDTLVFDDLIEIVSSSEDVQLEDFDFYYDDAIVTRIHTAPLKMDLETLEILEGALVED